MNNILVLQSSNKVGSPAYERVKAFENFFSKNGFCVFLNDYPSSFSDFIKILNSIKSNKIGYLYISQPPFNFFILFLIPFLKIIIDYRDGWSIANLHGYGGLKKQSLFKYYISRNIERLCMIRSSLIITCTEGLQIYLANIIKRDVLLITNGISLEKYTLINKYSRITLSEGNELRFACAGQFSEYGTDKVKKIISTIHSRYPENKNIINIYGANIEKNYWIYEYIKAFGNIDIALHDRLTTEELYLELSKADMFISVIRDPSYDYGTKIFEYISFNKPVLNYFDSTNPFLEYFDGAFDLNIRSNLFLKPIIREVVLDEKAIMILDKLS